MIAALAMLAAVSLTPIVACTGLPSHDAPPDLRTLFERGRTYAEFRDAATRRTRAWREHYADAVVADTVLHRLAAVPGRWMLLVVAEDWCGDSANTIPYLARLVDQAPNLDMRIVDSDAGREVMETHRTPDGRAATPTIVLLDEAFAHAGCWVERPSALQEWFLDSEGDLEEDELYRQKYDWYADDAGASTVREIVGMIEVAAAGQPGCRD
jgi:hypothetical protein